MELVPSDNRGLKLCLGCFSQMGEDVIDVIGRFGERDQIVFVHFRDVVGAVPIFHETFVDDGNFDTVEVVRTLQDIGYEGAVIPDHIPEWLVTTTGGIAAVDLHSATFVASSIQSDLSKSNSPRSLWSSLRHRDCSPSCPVPQPTDSAALFP